MRAASYNIRKAVGLDMRRDPMRVLDIINGLDADVVALQEADKRLGPRPGVLNPRAIERESDFRLVPLGQNDVSHGWHGNAVLLRKDIELGGVDHIDLPGFEPRGAVAVDVVKNGRHVKLVGTHLGLLRASRRKQLETICSYLGDEGAARAMIVGDFNEWSESRGLEALAAFKVVSPGKSFHAARLLAGLDRLALGSALDFYDAGVEQGPQAKVASDHLPVWADIDF
ncbi:endonuclease/exonuclease/phosphatase family protein [Qingshengfaniella alkalisoli]|uniref:Metal-dependent hydrolase n=1 Tax=Qingshengfaniella alkalisoli TaxID=2599296 RepID=A0A5B8J3I4_9RHOB|nr:endonuclease/exonuclease/phosphatase family protein [Qingshengfaniella alkalisoli]QDY71278.1 metal-dependent hydrolase [Qingshengfaniella alkalisoli]